MQIKKPEIIVDLFFVINDNIIVFIYLYSYILILSVNSCTISYIYYFFIFTVYPNIYYLFINKHKLYYNIF